MSPDPTADDPLYPLRRGRGPGPDASAHHGGTTGGPHGLGVPGDLVGHPGGRPWPRAPAAQPQARLHHLPQQRGLPPEPALLLSLWQARPPPRVPRRDPPPPVPPPPAP